MADTKTEPSIGARHFEYLEAYNPTVLRAIEDTLAKDLRKTHAVTALTQKQDGKWIISLEKRPVFA